MNCLQLIKEAYKQATAEPFGHLLIDLDPNTSQGLRFSSQLIGPDPSIFYISSPEAVITTIKNECKMHTEEFVLIPRQIYANEQPQIAQLLNNKTVREKAKQISLLQRSKSPPAPSTTHEKPLRKFADRRVEKSERIKIFRSDSGIRLIKLIALPCIIFLEQNAH